MANKTNYFQFSCSACDMPIFEDDVPTTSDVIDVWSSKPKEEAESVGKICSECKTVLEAAKFNPIRLLELAKFLMNADQSNLTVFTTRQVNK